MEWWFNNRKSQYLLQDTLSRLLSIDNIECKSPFTARSRLRCPQSSHPSRHHSGILRVLAIEPMEAQG
jgi:hypothetical protein